MNRRVKRLILPAITTEVNAVKRFFFSKWLRFTLAGLALIVFGLAATCVYFGVYSSQDVYGYRDMSSGHWHPVWKDLALRRIQLGDSADELKALHPPPMEVRYDNFVEYRYTVAPPGYISLSGLSVLAMDGKLIEASAGSCTWSHTFFRDDAKYLPAEEAMQDESWRENVEVVIAAKRED